MEDDPETHGEESETTPTQLPYYEIYTQPKNKLTAALLALFLGAFGIHKFYLGYPKAGFIMLTVTIVGSVFTLGFAGIVMATIGFIEGFVYLMHSQQKFEAYYVCNRREWF